MSEWIAVEERLPTKRGEYLTFTAPFVAMGHRVEGRRAVLDWTGSKWRSSLKVTHWTQIPAAPLPLEAVDGK